ncbi:MAG: hypothetical protein Q9164_006035 [Protoblastenia rupestris]
MLLFGLLLISLISATFASALPAVTALLKAPSPVSSIAVSTNGPKSPATAASCNDPRVPKPVPETSLLLSFDYPSPYPEITLDRRTVGSCIAALYLSLTRRPPDQIIAHEESAERDDVLVNLIDLTETRRQEFALTYRTAAQVIKFVYLAYFELNGPQRFRVTTYAGILVAFGNILYAGPLTNGVRNGTSGGLLPSPTAGSGSAAA